MHVLPGMFRFVRRCPTAVLSRTGSLEGHGANPQSLGDAPRQYQVPGNQSYGHSESGANRPQPRYQHETQNDIACYRNQLSLDQIPFVPAHGKEIANGTKKHIGQLPTAENNQRPISDTAVFLSKDQGDQPLSKHDEDNRHWKRQCKAPTCRLPGQRLKLFPVAIAMRRTM